MESKDRPREQTRNKSSAQQSQGCRETGFWGEVGIGSRHLPANSPTHSQAAPALAWSPKM